MPTTRPSSSSDEAPPPATNPSKPGSDDPARSESSVLEEEKPLLEDEEPIVEEEKPLLEDEKPIVQEEKPLLEDEKPIVQEEKPLLEDEKLIVQENAAEATGQQADAESSVEEVVLTPRDSGQPLASGPKRGGDRARRQLEEDEPPNFMAVSLTPKGPDEPAPMPREVPSPPPVVIAEPAPPRRSLLQGALDAVSAWWMRRKAERPRREKQGKPPKVQSEARPEVRAEARADSQRIRVSETTRQTPAPPRRPVPGAPVNAVAEVPMAAVDAETAGLGPDRLKAFAPFARVLGVEIPSEPAPLSDEEEGAENDLAAQLVERFSGSKQEQISFPLIALQILEFVAEPDADVTKLAGLLSRDPALSASVVSVANSPVFRGVSEIETVRDAVTRLGMAEVGRIAAAVSARTLFSPQVRAERAAFASRSTMLFKQSFAIASAAAQTAMRQRGARSDRAYLGGLLADLGKALALRTLARLVLDSGVQEPDPVRLTRVLDRVHVEIGTAAHQALALPQYLADICALHHEERAPEGPEFVELHLVRVASALADVYEPLFAWRAAGEIVQSAAALRIDPFAVRAMGGELRDAARRAEALPR